MRWVGVAIIIVGVLAYLSSASFQQWTTAKAVKIQLVDGDKVISEPFNAVVPSESTFVKGTGKEQSQFLEKSKPHIPVAQYDRIFALAKAASLATMALGAVGFLFESWRIKTRRILES